MKHSCDKCKKAQKELHSTREHEFWYCEKCFNKVFPEINEKILLNEKDFLNLLDNIENPPEPNEAFKKAAQNYKEKYENIPS